jgi:hypothetical protein
MIIELDDQRVINADIVGGKAKSLAIIKKSGLNVPDFFCIPYNQFKNVESPSFKKILNIKFSHLIQSYNSVIVRSSANIEDSVENVFPGIFLSIAGIKSFDELCKSIKSVYKSKSTKTVEYYCKLKNLDRNKLKLSLIIQGEIIPSFSGVLFTQSPLKKDNLGEEFYVEIVKGKNDKLLSGINTGTGYTLEHNKSKAINKKFKIPPSLLNDLYSQAIKIRSLFSYDVDIEWSYLNDKLFFLQARPMSSYSKRIVSKRIHTSHNRNIRDKILPLENEIGLKGAAMKFFIENGLFGLNAIFINPNSSLSFIKNELDKLAKNKQGITIRFSYKNNIGMPRFFAKSVDEAYDIIKTNWKKEWLIIVHDFFIVAHSFELYLDKNEYLIEHIPGMWESENTLEPDVILNNEDKMKYMRFTKSRKSKQVFHDSVKIISYKPCTRTQLKAWNKTIATKIHFLHNKFAPFLPLNFHYVEDENNNLVFLNIRRSSCIKKISENKSFFHIVRNITDLNNWDGKQDILLQIPIERGYEKLLEIFVQSLPTNLKNIYIQFGALSHPAIMLRELGLNPIPVYFNHEIFN